MYKTGLIFNKEYRGKKCVIHGVYWRNVWGYGRKHDDGLRERHKRNGHWKKMYLVVPDCYNEQPTSCFLDHDKVKILKS